MTIPFHNRSHAFSINIPNNNRTKLKLNNNKYNNQRSNYNNICKHCSSSFTIYINKKWKTCKRNEMTFCSPDCLSTSFILTKEYKDIFTNK